MRHFLIEKSNMELKEIIAIWGELHVKDTGELGFYDLADAVEKVVGITRDGVKVRDLDPALSPEVWIDKRLAELRENQQPNS